MAQTCPNCGARDVSTPFCTSCGVRMPAVVAPEPPTEPMHTPAPAPAPVPAPTPAGVGGASRRPLVAGLVALGCVAIAGGVAAVLVSKGGKDGTPPAAAAGRRVAQTAPAPQAQTVTVTQPEPAPAPAPAPAPDPTTPTTTVPAPPKTVVITPAVEAKASIKRVIRTHWKNIAAGEFEAAFAALAPGTQNRATWIDDHRHDALTDARISLGAPTLTSSTTATVPVRSLHTEATSGCNDWTGHYEMVKSGGAWKIEKAKISNTPC
jgi:hypothetical protein